MKIHDSARQHGVDPDDAAHAAEHAVFVSDLNEDSPARQLRLGFDPASRLLEVVVLRFDGGNELLIHAMKARRQYVDLLDWSRIGLVHTHHDCLEVIVAHRLPRTMMVFNARAKPSVLDGHRLRSPDRRRALRTRSSRPHLTAPKLRGSIFLRSPRSASGSRPTGHVRVLTPAEIFEKGVITTNSTESPKPLM